MASPLHESIAALPPTMRRGDLEGFQDIYDRLANDSQGLTPDQLTAAVEELAPILARRPSGIFARLALVAGAYVEWGASPVALAEDAPECAAETMFLRIKFSDMWPAASGGRPEPDHAQEPPMNELVELFRGKAKVLRVSPKVATAIAYSWFDVDHWVSLMITLMGRREFRDHAEELPFIGELAAMLGDRVPGAEWLPDLSVALDDEPLVAIDLATRRGFRLTMSGLGDNYQLHTLLAGQIIGDPAQGLLAGAPPDPAWVAAATSGPTRLPDGGPIRRLFRLYDAAGGYVDPEGRPADIARVAGARVVALHPPGGNYRWHDGRVYMHMLPSLTLDHVMSHDEAEEWLARIAPARQTDMFAPKPSP